MLYSEISVTDRGHEQHWPVLCIPCKYLHQHTRSCERDRKSRQKALNMTLSDSATAERRLKEGVWQGTCDNKPRGPAHALLDSAIAECRHNEELEQDSMAMQAQTRRLQREADSLTRRLEAVMQDKHGPRSSFDAATPIDKTLQYLQDVIMVRRARPQNSDIAMLHGTVLYLPGSPPAVNLLRGPSAEPKERRKAKTSNRKDLASIFQQSLAWGPSGVGAAWAYCPGTASPLLLCSPPHSIWQPTELGHIACCCHRHSPVTNWSNLAC